jgi:hypothetical protein
VQINPNQFKTDRQQSELMQTHLLLIQVSRGLIEEGT